MVWRVSASGPQDLLRCLEKLPRGFGMPPPSPLPLPSSFKRVDRRSSVPEVMCGDDASFGRNVLLVDVDAFGESWMSTCLEKSRGCRQVWRVVDIDTFGEGLWLSTRLRRGYLHVQYGGGL